MNIKNILEQDKSGDEISVTDPEYYKIRNLIKEAQEIIAELNTGYKDEKTVRSLFSKLTGSQMDTSFRLLPPFYTDFGKNIRAGKNVFINHCCEFMDRGGIILEDNVLIGPKVNLITINHSIDPRKRDFTSCSPIVIKKNVWIGASATILGGVTVGENSIVAAGAIVNKDVPPDSMVGGIPAKIIKHVKTTKTFLQEF